MTFVRYLLGAVVLLAGLSGVIYIQQRYDQADAKKALTALQRKFPELKDCAAVMESRFQGVVQIKCGDDPRTWHVDVTRAIIRSEP